MSSYKLIPHILRTIVDLHDAAKVPTVTNIIKGMKSNFEGDSSPAKLTSLGKHVKKSLKVGEKMGLFNKNRRGIYQLQLPSPPSNISSFKRSIQKFFGNLVDTQSGTRQAIRETRRRSWRWPRRRRSHRRPRTRLGRRIRQRVRSLRRRISRYRQRRARRRASRRRRLSRRREIPQLKRLHRSDGRSQHRHCSSPIRRIPNKKQIRRVKTSKGNRQHNSRFSQRLQQKLKRSRSSVSNDKFVPNKSSKKSEKIASNKSSSNDDKEAANKSSVTKDNNAGQQNEQKSQAPTRNSEEMDDDDSPFDREEKFKPDLETNDG